MKPKPMSHSQNTENSSPHKLRKNNAPIIHGWPGYEMHNGRPLEEQKSNLTKRNLNIYYGGHVGEVAAPNANFFVPKRRKPANLESCYAEKSLKNPIGGTSNEMVDNINEGLPTHLCPQSSVTRCGVCLREGQSQNNQPNSDNCVVGLSGQSAFDIVEGTCASHSECSQQIQRRNTEDNEDTVRQLHISDSDVFVQPAGELISPHAPTDPPVRSGSPSKQTKKWSQQSSEVISTYVQRHDAPDCAHNDGELPPFHIGQGIGGDGHRQTNVAPHICYQPHIQKRKECIDQISKRGTQRCALNDDVCVIGEPSASNLAQTEIAVDGHGQPSIPHTPGYQGQPTKRNRHRNEASTRRVRQRGPASNSHPHSDDDADVRTIGEPSTSILAETGIRVDGNAQRNVTHAAGHEGQPRKRNRCRNEPSTRRVRQRRPASNLHPHSDDASSSIAEASSSYAAQDASPAYDDLGDCTERCTYCNAAFWRDERLRSTSSLSGVPQYHLCCGAGKVYMEPDPDPPDYIKHLLGDANFIESIRAYNQMFAMTSFGAPIDSTVNQGRGPYVFKISGQVYHRIGSLLPTGDDDPKFLQLYIYDTKNEVQNRLNHFSDSEAPPLDPEVVQGLIHFLDAHNELVQIFRTARDKCAQADVPEFKIRLYSGEGPRGYELPASHALGAIVFDRGPESDSNFDVVLEYRDGPLKRISKIHKSYMSLQFPLIFIYGQPGYHTKLKLRPTNPNHEPKRVSMNAFYTYELHPRHDSYNLLFRTGRLFQQYVVSVYCSIEQNRMDFYRTHQNDIRGEFLSGLYDAILRGDREGSEVGSRIILPSSFTGGPRYMYSHYLDALAICRVLGNP